ncbi:LysE family translocator [Marinospirillum alkaliphilum]|uniref:Threonine/homoserine/homoserine lactone efflux protein n=1 Tax=Marinospirillum alkaliphilum DSM 21637 TaxID=1122209 RepID=A0A1K1Z173_9GAMM|nr:LysE family translocator [Marinospirillum alkaliphilum]SFX67317.1 Threonine/homoserine/homoserine lactone efflux protein [Marinospirillum alkaliphilum DSM 21637]
MTLAAWLSVATICFLGAASPGPSLAMVLRHTLSGSRRNGIIAALAHGAGVGLYALLVVLGLGRLLVELPGLYQLLAWGGAAYLAWLGIQALRAGQTSALHADALQAPTALTAVRDGFMVAFLNPKLAIFFVALFSQFIQPGQSLETKLILAATAWSIDTGWYLLVAFGLSHSQVLPWLQQRARWINRITGCLLLLLALRVITL